MLKPASPQMPTEPGEERPIGEIVHQLVEDGKAYAGAELGLAKAIVLAKASRLKLPAILLGAALLVLQAAITVLAVAVGVALMPLAGPLVAGLLAFLLFAAIAGGLGWIAIRKAGRDL